jgi:tripartite-type tricarboxylate transporter receptor subunit TctC
MKASIALSALALSASLGVSGLALAQKPAGLPGNYPSKPVKVIIPVGPGGGTDFLARLVFGKLGDMWSSTFIAENHTAAGGMVAMDQLAKGPADGHALAFASSATYIRAAFVAKLDWDVRKAFVPIAPVSLSTLMLAAYNGAPFKNFKEMIAYAKANPGQLQYGSSAIGSSSHLTAELIFHKTGVKATIIPYKGTGQAVTDTVAGRVPAIIGSVAALTPHIKSGKLTLIGVTSGKRVESAPDFLTISEAGLPGFDYAGWFGIVGPAKMPPATVNAINKAVMDILRMPDVKAAMTKSGADQMYGSPEEFRKTTLDALDRTAEVLKATGLELKED